MIRLTKIIGISALAFALAALFAPPGQAAMKKHKLVQFTSGSPTGGWFPVASAMSELKNAKYDGHPISVVTGAGGVDRVVRSTRTHQVPARAEHGRNRGGHADEPRVLRQGAELDLGPRPGVLR